MDIVKNKTNRPAMALIVVLLVVMIAALVSLSFISRSDVELTCGDNMITRVQTNYLAESGLEHAKGLILSPQDVSPEYWTGAVRQQLVAGSNEYYDVAVSKTSNCNYQVISDSYRLNGATKINKGSLGAEVRLDPAVAFWAGADTAVWDGITVNGDTYCKGTLDGDGHINGDAFAKYGINIPTANIQGKININVADTAKPVEFPVLNVSDFSSTYYINLTQYTSRQEINVTRSGVTYNPTGTNPAGVVYCPGNIELQGNVLVTGTLIVNGNLRISGVGNVITAVKNFPAILINGNLIIEQAGRLQITGAAIVKGRVLLNESATGSTVTGALCINEDIVPMTADSSIKKNDAILNNWPLWVSGKIGTGALDFDGSSQYLVVPNNSALQITNGLTIAAWIKADSWGFGTNVNVIVRKGEISPASYQLCIANRKVTLMLNESDSDGVSGWTILNAGQWYHVAATWDGTNARIYVNGALNSFAINRHYNLPADSRDFYLGGRDSSDYFNGTIDAVQIYNRKLSDAEVWDIMDGSTKIGLVGNWKFNENGNSTLAVTVAPNKAALQTWPSAGTAQRWTPAGGAFFKSIARR